MTPGQAALAEAARLETARIYAGNPLPVVEHARPVAAIEAEEKSPRVLETAIEYLHRNEGQSAASIAFRLGIPKRTVEETLHRFAS